LLARFFAGLVALGAVWAAGSGFQLPGSGFGFGGTRNLNAEPGTRNPEPTEIPFVWNLPPGIPRPAVPADNPMSEAKVRLGRRLFHDTRVSGNGTFSCASCHQQARAFTDGLAHALGSTGQAHPRSAMSLANVAFNASYGWADGRTRTLEAQMTVPMFNEHPIEMGIKGNEAAIVARIAGDSVDAAMFRQAFPSTRPDRALAHDRPDDSRPVTLDRIIKSIAAFERTIVSANSPLDRYLYRDDRTALTAEARRGMTLFFSDRLACARCHSGFNLSGPTVHDGSAAVTPTFHNTGLYNIDGRGSYPAIDRGLLDTTHVAADMGRFRAPTLRNIAVTAPYMHDGSIPTLGEVVGHYASGGLKSSFKSPRLKGFAITTAEVSDLVAFLNSLTDAEFLSNPALGAPGR
jgi:cytochrome c peroxidase